MTTLNETFVIRIKDWSNYQIKGKVIKLKSNIKKAGLNITSATTKEKHWWHKTQEPLQNLKVRIY